MQCFGVSNRSEVRRNPCLTVCFTYLFGTKGYLLRILRGKGLFLVNLQQFVFFQKIQVVPRHPLRGHYRCQTDKVASPYLGRRRLLPMV